MIKVNYPLEKEEIMYGQDRVYKKVEIVGVSKNGFEEAIQAGVSKAHKTLEKLSWFEVGDIRGHVGDDGEIKEWQVVLKVSFQLKE
jgi:flavin-binding protein dodecin